MALVLADVVVERAAVLVAAVAEDAGSKLRKEVNLKDTFNERSV